MAIPDLLARIRAFHLLWGIRRSLIDLTDRELLDYLAELEGHHAHQRNN